MFTGIVDHVGNVTQRTDRLGSLLLEVETTFEDLREGESISVDGACLTVVNPRKGRFVCELSCETIDRTVAGHYESGTLVNLERALLPTDRLGGHWVSGHIDGTAKVASIDVQKDFWKIEFSGLGPSGRGLLIEKGSVALLGVSLTINAVTNDGFSVMLIPHTLERTNLKSLRVGQSVNLEFDWMVKVIRQQVQENLERLLAQKGLS